MLLETQGVRALLAAASVLFITCVSACYEDDTWRIDVQGFVSDADTGEPVPTAQVRLEVLEWKKAYGLNSTSTDPTGWYRLKYTRRQGCPRIALDIVVDASGYQQYSNFSATFGNDLPRIRCEPERQRVDIELVPFL